MRPYGWQCGGHVDLKSERRYVRTSKRQKRVEKRSFHVVGRRQGRHEIRQQLSDINRK